MLKLNAFNISPKDSIGLTKSKGELVVMHKVDKGESLYSIARRYYTTVDEIQKLNKGIKTVKVEQKIKIPYNPTAVNSAKTILDSNKITVDESHANADSKEVSYVKTYKVQQGETLNKIATKFKTTPQLLIKWNGIKNNNITVGQEIIVEGVTSLKSYEKWNTVNSLTTKIDTPHSILSNNFNQIEENGFVSLTPKITHSTLPIGSFILCVNPITLNQLLLQVEQNSLLLNYSILGLTQDILDRLNIKNDNPLIIIKYNQR